MSVRHRILIAAATALLTAAGALSYPTPATAAATVTASGTVTDGSGHGYPLSARLDVVGLSGGPVFTDPGTGRYSFQATAGTTYRITVSALYPGYQALKSELAVGTVAVTKDFALPVDPGCTAAGYTGSFDKPTLTQSFDGTEPPDGWSVVNRTASGGWTFTDVKDRGNLTGGSGNFAIIDSDGLGSGNSQDTDLVTPPVDLSAAPAPFLRFNSDWRSLGSGADSADVDVSTDGGTSWTTVWHQTTSRRGPRVEEIPLTPAAGEASALVRFHFQGSFAWWWEVDDVQVVNRSCTPVPGGLVVGKITDKNTGQPLAGVKVSSVDTPADAGVSDSTGFYWLFATAVGTHAFTATKQPYQQIQTDLAVVADGTVRADLALPAARLVVSPSAVGFYQPYGSVRTATVTVQNTGTAPADVDLGEVAGDFTILSVLGKQGAKQVTQQVPGGLSKAMREPVKAGQKAISAAAAPAVDNSWTQIADYPVDIFDNAAATVAGKVYSVGGGIDTGTENKAYSYDPVAKAWTALPNLPTARAKPQAVGANGKLYVFGGWAADGTPVASVDVFDPQSSTWSTLGATNPKPRAAAGAALAGGKIYLIGGCVDGACTDSADVVRFDPASGAFSAATAYPHTSSWMSCGGISDKVYCAGGVSTIEHTDGFAYDPASDSWSPIAGMPLDLWGSAHAAAGGLLVIMGGVTDSSTAITNRTVGYDPVTDTWMDLPDNAFGRFRSAGACGAFKVGGSIGNFVGTADSETLGGLGDCTQEQADVPWLASDPASFTLAPGASQAVTVTLTATAAAGVAQPGTYTAQISVAANSPYPVASIPVQLTALPPASWGKAQGTVTGKACNGTSVPLPAVLRFNSVADPTVGYTVLADAAGHFAYWLPRGRYDVIIAKDGWIPEVHRIQITAGSILTHDVPLSPIVTCR